MAFSQIRSHIAMLRVEPIHTSLHNSLSHYPPPLSPSLALSSAGPPSLRLHPLTSHTDHSACHKMHCTGGAGLAENNPVCVCMRMSACVRVCLHACVCASVHACIHVFYTFMYVCVYLCRNAAISWRRLSAAWERRANRWHYSSAWLRSGAHQPSTTPVKDGPRSSSRTWGRAMTSRRSSLPYNEPRRRTKLTRPDGLSCWPHS